MNDLPRIPNDAPKDLAHRVLDQIEQERVVPRPKWQFTLQNGLFFGSWILCVVIGSLIAAACFFALTHAGWEYRELMRTGFFAFLLQILPTMWLIGVLCFLVLAYENFRHTRLGYRTPLFAAIGLPVLIMVIGGGLLSLVGVGRFVEEDLGKHIPAYHPTMMRQRMAWSRPEQGLLGGEVRDIQNDFSTFTLRSFDGKTMILSGSDLTETSREILVREPSVRIIGVFAGPDAPPGVPFFRPCYVFPWEKGDARGKRVACDTPERTIEESRSKDCKGLIPYPVLKTLQRRTCR